MNDTVFVKLYVDLHCDWQGLPPDYRIYVDNEMFAERTFRFEEPVYLTEILQIESDVNEVHYVRLEPVGPQLATFRFENPRVAYCEQKVKVVPDSALTNRFTFKVRA
jgi:hypothetical protein